MFGSCRRGATASLVVGLALLVSGCQQSGAGWTEKGSGSAAIGTHSAAASTCTATGAHAKHAEACTTCHACGPGVSFDPSSPAVAAGQPSPTFDTTAKTCSNVACHTIPAGTYTYSRWDYGCDCPGEPVTVPYGGTGAAPHWYATGSAGCAACHGNPPVNYDWHGKHGGGNSCTLCHPHVLSEQVGTTSQYVGVGFSTAMTCGPNRNESCAALHANGVLDVSPGWKSSCFGCH